MVENTSVGLPRGLDLRPYDFKTFNKIAYGCPFEIRYLEPNFLPHSRLFYRVLFNVE